ncbi:MAG: amidohydrolase family protein, partial [Candidatus Ornithomonoglobus sp.]
KTARTQDGALAGSTSTLFECVQCAIKFGIPESDAFKMASATPARHMGLNRGIIELGRDCDLIIVNDKNELDTVIIGGKII